MTADPATDAAQFFHDAMQAARQAAADAYALAETTGRLWDLAVTAQGSLGGPVGLDDILADAALRGGEAERAHVQALLSRYLDLIVPDQGDDEPDREEPER